MNLSRAFVESRVVIGDHVFTDAQFIVLVILLVLLVSVVVAGTR